MSAPCAGAYSVIIVDGGRTYVARRDNECVSLVPRTLTQRGRKCMQMPAASTVTAISCLLYVFDASRICWLSFKTYSSCPMSFALRCVASTGATSS